MVGHHKSRSSGRNIQRSVVLQLHQHGKSLRWPIREVKPYCHVHGFGFPGGLQVEIYDEVRARIQLPTHILRFFLRRRAGLPEQEVGVWIEFARDLGFHIHAGESRLAILPVALPQHACVVHDEIRVMHRSLAARPQFHGADIFGLLQFHRDHKIPKDILSGGGHLIRLAHVQHQVRLAELPPFHEVRSRRQLRAVAFRRACLGPARQQIDLCIRQPLRAGEITVARLGRPRRHEALSSDDCNLLGVLPRVLVAQ